jgi:hypothetical protein
MVVRVRCRADLRTFVRGGLNEALWQWLRAGFSVGGDGDAVERVAWTGRAEASLERRNVRVPPLDRITTNVALKL